MAITDAPGALTDVRVLDLTGGLAGPAARMLPADPGADASRCNRSADCTRSSQVGAFFRFL